MRTKPNAIGTRRLLIGPAAVVLGTTAVLGGTQTTAGAQQPARHCAYTTQSDVPTTMRDGTTLRANVFTPKGKGDFPVILMRLPYNKDNAESFFYSPPGDYAAACYVVVVQDVRGQYTSDGTFYPYRSEATDGYDTIEWAARLPHSDGKVGMYGFSYPGLTQWMPATLRPPHLVTIIPAFTSSDYYDGWTYEGGALYQSFTQSWPVTLIANSAVRHLPDGAALDAEMNQAAKDLFGKWYWYLPFDTFPPLHPDDSRVAPYYYDWIRHPSDDAYWQRWSIRTRYPQITVPALNFGGWYDIFLKGTTENFAGLQANGGSPAARHGSKLVLGPWTHGDAGSKIGDVDFGPSAAVSIDRLQHRWFDYWLKGIHNGSTRTRR